jgi:hypothetical protein
VAQRLAWLLPVLDRAHWATGKVDLTGAFDNRLMTRVEGPLAGHPSVGTNRHGYEKVCRTHSHRCRDADFQA